MSPPASYLDLRRLPQQGINNKLTWCPRETWALNKLCLVPHISKEAELPWTTQMPTTSASAGLAGDAKLQLWEAAAVPWYRSTGRRFQRGKIPGNSSVLCGCLLCGTWDTPECSSRSFLSVIERKEMMSDQLRQNGDINYSPVTDCSDTKDYIWFCIWSV